MLTRYMAVFPSENEKAQHGAEKESSRPSGSVRYEEVLMSQAYDHMSKKEYRDAADIFNDILRRFSVSLEDKQKSLMNSELGTLYFWLGDYDSAKTHCETSLAYSGGENDQAYNILGKVAVAQFKFPQARGYFSKMSGDNPLRSLGFCLISLKLRDTIGAETFLKEARAKNIPPTDPEFRVYNAYLHLLKGDAKAATLEAREVLPKCDHDPNLAVLAAEVLMTAGDYGEAASIAQKVLKVCPENDSAFAVLAWASHAEEDLGHAEAHAREAVRLNPFNAYAKTVLMKLATHSASYSMAESIGTQIINDCPEYSLAHANLGDVYFNQGRFELAQIEYEQTQHSMTADTKGTRLRNARMKFIEGDYAGAADILEKLILAHHTYYDDAMCDLLLCYDKVGDEEKCDEVIEKMQIRKSFYQRTERILLEFNH